MGGQLKNSQLLRKDGSHRIVCMRRGAETNPRGKARKKQELRTALKAQGVVDARGAGAAGDSGSSDLWKKS